MMQVLIDQNVFLSALFKRQSTARQIVEAWFAGSFTLVTSQLQHNELAELFERPHIKPRVPPEDANLILGLLLDNAVFGAASVQIKLCRDPDDDALLEIAASHRVDYLVTGDKDLLEDDNLKKVMLKQHDVRVVNPNEFLTVLEAQE